MEHNRDSVRFSGLSTRSDNGLSCDIRRLANEVRVALTRRASFEVPQCLLCPVNLLDFLSLSFKFRLTVLSEVFHHLGGISSFRSSQKMVRLRGVRLDLQTQASSTLQGIFKRSVKKARCLVWSADRCSLDQVKSPSQEIHHQLISAPTASSKLLILPSP